MLIYKITHKVSGRAYIGQKRQSFEKRLSAHLSARSLLIDQAIAEEGSDAFTFEVLEECDNLEQMNQREKELIAEFDTLYPDGFNKHPGGRSKGSGFVSDNRWLADFRARTGLTIKQVADCLGAPYQTVVDWNNGRRNPPEWLKPILLDAVERAILARLANK